MTGCARFFLFLLFFVPLTYFGVHYIQGEDGLQKLKDFFGKSEKIESNQSRSNKSENTIDLQEALDAKDAEIKKLESRIEILEEMLEQKNEEIKDLKN